MSKRLRKAVSEAGDIGGRNAELGCFKAKYLGSYKVNNSTASAVAYSSKKAKSLKSKDGKVNVLLSARSIRIVDRSSGDVVQNHEFMSVSYYGVNSTKKDEFGYITSLGPGLFYCHLVHVGRDSVLLQNTMKHIFEEQAVARSYEEKQKQIAAQQTAKADAMRKERDNQRKRAQQVQFEQQQRLREENLNAQRRGSKTKISQPPANSLARGPQSSGPPIPHRASMNRGNGIAPPRGSVSGRGRGSSRAPPPRRGSGGSTRAPPPAGARRGSGDLPNVPEDAPLDTSGGGRRPSASQMPNQAVRRNSKGAVGVSMRGRQPSLPGVQRRRSSAGLKAAEGAGARALQAARDAAKNSPYSLMSFEAVYLGSEPLRQLAGDPPVRRALERNRATRRQFQRTYGNTRQVAHTQNLDGSEIVKFEITPTSVRLVEQVYQNVIHTEFMKHICYITVLESDDAHDSFAFISFIRRVGSITAHLFRLPPGNGKKIYEAIDTAQKRQAEEERKRGNNPFAIMDPKRDTVSGSLLKRQIHRGALTAVQMLGAGQFGEVWSATQSVPKGYGDNGSDKKMRAVKLLKGEANQADKKEFLQEAETMIQLNHNSLIRIVGAAVQQKPWLAVLEFMEYGDLRGVLLSCKEKKFPVATGEFLQWMADLSDGCGYIASKRMVHMDIAARNIMIGKGSVVKVGDFGLTRPYDQGKSYYTLSEALRLPLKWVSLEGVTTKRFGEPSDVWAFGILMWEMVTYGQMPYRFIKTAQVPMKVKQGYRMPKPAGCDDELYEIVQKCWIPDTNERWKFAPLSASLRKLQKAKHPVNKKRDIGALLASTERHATTQANDPSVRTAAQNARKKSTDFNVDLSDHSIAQAMTNLQALMDEEINLREEHMLGKKPQPRVSVKVKPMPSVPENVAVTGNTEGYYIPTDEAPVEAASSDRPLSAGFGFPGDKEDNRKSVVDDDGTIDLMTAQLKTDSSTSSLQPMSPLSPLARLDDDEGEIFDGPESPSGDGMEDEFGFGEDESSELDQLTAMVESTVAASESAGAAVVQQEEEDDPMFYDEDGLPLPEAQVLAIKQEIKKKEEAAAEARRKQQEKEEKLAEKERQRQEKEAQRLEKLRQKEEEKKKKEEEKRMKREKSRREKKKTDETSAKAAATEEPNPAPATRSGAALWSVAKKDVAGVTMFQEASRIAVIKRQRQLAEERAARAAELELSQQAEKHLQTRDEARKKYEGLFTESEETKTSKIYQALNPTPLAYEPRREQEADSDDEDAVIQLGTLGAKNFNYSRDAQMEGFMEDELEAKLAQAEAEANKRMEEMKAAQAEEDENDSEDDEEDDSDFDDEDLKMDRMLEEYLDQKRNERVQEELAHREKLKGEWQEKQRRESEMLEQELAIIRKREAEEQREKERAKEAAVKEAQQRLSEDMVFEFKWG